MSTERTDPKLQYGDVRPTYEAFAARLQSLVSELLRIREIKVHLVESRAKTLESFAEKINRPGKHYTDPLQEIPDLVGVRVIVYYADAVSSVAQLLKSELEILETEEAHQPANYAPDRFGYLSMHYIIALNAARKSLPEWAPYAELRAEIQVRSLLQHTWAAISHVLQYKKESDVPLQLRRRLFRLAGLFELGDEEFVAIRDARVSLLENTKKALEHGDESLPVDSASLEEFIRTWDQLPEYRQYLESIGYSFYDSSTEDEDRDDVGQIVTDCDRMGIRTISDFRDIVSYDAKPFLTRIFEDQWIVSNEFVVYLILIGARPDYYTVPVLKKAGWDARIATKVINGAKKRKANIHLRSRS